MYHKKIFVSGKNICIMKKKYVSGKKNISHEKIYVSWKNVCIMKKIFVS